MMGFRGALLAGILLAPRRGAGWEARRPGEGGAKSTLRAAGVVLRYGYPLLAVFLFFEEIPRLVEALHGSPPWGFETTLLGWERAFFGGSPAPGTASIVGAEIVHGLYSGYYALLAGGLPFAWLAGRKGPAGVRPGPAFAPALAGVVLAFLLSFALFLILPARAPRHLPGLGDPSAVIDGVAFVPFVRWIQELGGIEGGAFPSAHVAAVWGLVGGLSARRPRAASYLALVALAVTMATPLTPYHHGMDAVAGVAVGLLAAAFARRLAGRSHRYGR